MPLVWGSPTGEGLDVTDGLDRTFLWKTSTSEGINLLLRQLQPRVCPWQEKSLDALGHSGLCFRLRVLLFLGFKHFMEC